MSIMTNLTPKTISSIGLTLAAVLLLGASCGTPSDGGVFRSVDGGQVWDQKTYVGQNGRRTVNISNVNILAITMDPVDPNKLYVGTKGNGIYRTSNAGEQWEALSSVSSGNIYDIAIDPNETQTIYGARNDTIIRSTDGGETWAVLYTDVKGGKINQLVVDSFDTNRVYAITSAGGVLKSYDRGENWDLRLQLDHPIIELVMASYDTRILYALDDSDQIYKTTNGGEPTIGTDGTEYINSGWTELITRELKKEFDDIGTLTDITMDPNDSTVIYMVTKRGILRSRDAAGTWEDVPTLGGFSDNQNTKISHFTVAPQDSNTLYFLLNGVINKSLDGGNTWQTLDTFKSSRTVSDVVIDYQTPQILYFTTELIEEKKGLIKTSSNN